MLSRDKALPAGIGAGRPVHPFAVTVEEPVAVSLILDILISHLPSHRFPCQPS